MVNLSAREKKLFYFFIILVGFLLWFKTFNSTLLPQYRYYLAQLEEKSTAKNRFAELKFTAELQEQELIKAQKELNSLKQQFPQTSGFLLSTIGALAAGKLEILKTEQISSIDESFYQIRTIEIQTRGELESTLEYLRGLETKTGIQIAKADLRLKEEVNKSVEGDFLIKQYFILNNEGVETMEPSTTYLSHLPKEFIETEFLMEETESTADVLLVDEAVLQETKTRPNFELAPYSFPIL